MTCWRTDSVLFLHMPKTAGTFISGRFAPWVGEDRGGLQHIPSHAGWADIPQELIGDRRVVGCIRDPLTWYLSLYHYGMQDDGTPGPLLAPWVPPELLDADGRVLDIPEAPARVIAGMVDPGAAGLDLGWRPESFMVPRAPRSEIRRDCDRYGYGLMTWVFLRMYARPEAWALPIDALEPGHLEVGLLVDSAAPWTIIEAFQPPGLPLSVFDALRSGPPVNARSMREGTRRWWSGRWQDYLNEVAAAQILERDRFVVGIAGGLWSR